MNSFLPVSHTCGDWITPLPKTMPGRRPKGYCDLTQKWPCLFGGDVGHKKSSSEVFVDEVVRRRIFPVGLSAFDALILLPMLGTGLSHTRWASCSSALF